MDESRTPSKNLDRLGLPRTKPYFNAGVLLLNLAYLRAHTSKAQILDFLSQNANRLKLQDQDALNLLYSSSATVLDDIRFNCLVNVPQMLSEPGMVDNAAIIHYAGWQKPWRIKWQSSFSHFWWDARKEEGLRPGEIITLMLGTAWKAINGNNIERFLLMPYHWLVAHLKRINDN